MSIATDVRAYADLALEQGKNVLSQANKRLTSDAPRPVFAVLGVADLVAAAVTKQAEMLGKRVETLPTDAAQNVAKVQDTGKSLISKTQDDALARITDLRNRLDTGVDTVRALPTLSVTAASITTVYLSNAKQVYGTLATRGESRLAELRNDPRVTRVLGDLDEVSSTIQARLAPVFGSVRSEVLPYLDSAFDAISEADLGESAAQPNRTSTTRRRATGSRAAAGTSAASRSTATKRTETKSTGTKSTGTKSTGTKSTDTKPAGTKSTGTKATETKPTPTKRTAAAGRSVKTTTTGSPTAKAGTRKAAAKTTTAARKAPATTTSTARKAAARTTTTARKAPATKV